MPTHRPTKNEKRRNKKKANSGSGTVPLNLNRKVEGLSSFSDALLDDDITIEYVSADYENDKDVDESVLNEFMAVFEKIAKPEELLGTGNSSEDIAPLIPRLTSCM